MFFLDILYYRECPFVNDQTSNLTFQTSLNGLCIKDINITMISNWPTHESSNTSWLVLLHHFILQKPLYTFTGSSWWESIDALTLVSEFHVWWFWVKLWSEGEQGFVHTWMYQMEPLKGSVLKPTWWWMLLIFTSSVVSGEEGSTGLWLLLKPLCHQGSQFYQFKNW